MRRPRLSVPRPAGGSGVGSRNCSERAVGIASPSVSGFHFSGTAVMGHRLGGLGPGPARCDLVRRLGPHDQQSKQCLQLDRNVGRCRRCRNCLSIVMPPPRQGSRSLMIRVPPTRSPFVLNTHVSALTQPSHAESAGRYAGGTRSCQECLSPHEQRGHCAVC